MANRSLISVVLILGLTACAAAPQKKGRPPAASMGAPAAQYAAAPRQAEEFPVSLVTNKPFLYAYTLAAGEPLPQTPIETIELKEAFLSDVLLKLLSGFDYKLSIDPEVNDRTLNDVYLSGSFADAMSQLGQQGGFFVRLEGGKVLNIVRRGTVDVPLPPLGYFSSYQQQNPNSNAAVFNRSIDYYSSLEQALKNIGVETIERKQNPSALRLSLNSSQVSSVNFTLDGFRAQKPTLALRARFYSIPEKVDLAGLLGVAATGDVLQGNFNNISLNRALQSRNVRSVLVESGLVLVPVDETIKFSAGVNSAIEGCGGGLPGALISTLQAVTSNNTLTLDTTVDVVRVSAPAAKCALPSPLPTVNKTFSAPLLPDESTLLTGIPLGSGRQLIVLIEKPKLIGYAVTQPPYSPGTAPQPAPDTKQEALEKAAAPSAPKKTEKPDAAKPKKKEKKISVKPIKKSDKAPASNRKISASSVGVIVNPGDGLSSVGSDSLPETRDSE